MRPSVLIGITILLLATSHLGCAKSNSITPPTDSDLIRLSVTRLYPDQPAIEAAKITITRTTNGTVGLPGRKIELTVSAGHTAGMTDRGDGTYEAVWNGQSVGEVLLTARDTDSSPVVETSLTFLALDYLEVQWDIPIKVANPISTGGWDTASFLYPSGDRLAFAYITLDYSLYTQGIVRSIGAERPGQVTPQTLNIYLGKRDTNNPSWWSGWTVDHARCNLFQATQTALAAPSVTSDGLLAFCTVQENTGSGYNPTTIYTVDPDFSETPVALGPPVDMDGFGEDNPYYDVTHGWLYFDTYDLSVPKANQDIRAARILGGMKFDDPVLVSGGLNTDDIEAQPFVYEPTSTLYFATDRQPRDYQYHLSIYKVPIYGDSAGGVPELVAKGQVIIGRPSISYDGKLFCFTYARTEPGGLNADIAISPKMP